jgi:hypothetical protein
MATLDNDIPDTPYERALSHPEAPVALAHLRVASKIKEIDRQIEVLSRKLSQGHARQRTG